MSEQQQIRVAKEGGIYLIALFIAKLTFLCALWNELHFVAISLSAFCVSYFIYRCISTQAFTTVYPMVRKYLKYKTIHRYFSHCKNHKEGRFWSQGDNQSPEKFFEKIVIRNPEAKGNKRLFFYKKHNQFLKSEPLINESTFQRQSKSQQYLRAREAYKKTIQELEAKGLKQKWFEEFCGLVKNNYSHKVKELLKTSEENLRSLIHTIEENFEVKIVKDFKEIPQKLEPVHIDEAIGRIALVHKTKCLPWAERLKKQENTANLLRNLVELVEMREQIDRALCSQFKISNQQREKIITKINNQLQKKKSGKELISVLIEIYNENIKVKDYKINWSSIKSSKGGLTVVESYVAGQFHADLMVNRQGKEQIYRAKPGQQNPWSFLSLASQLYRLKL